MTSRFYPCNLIAIACDKYIEAKDAERAERKEKWIRKYSYYTKGIWPFTEKWERCRNGTLHYLDKELYRDDQDTWHSYYFDCIYVSINESNVRQMQQMANSKGSDSVIAVDMDHFNLISGYYSTITEN